MDAANSNPPKSTGAANYALLGEGHVERGRKLFVTGLVMLMGTLLYLAYSANVDEIEHLFLGLLIFTLSAAPSLTWARSGGSRFPIFETILALCANSYALPLLNAREQLAGFPPDLITKAGLIVIFYQISAILTYIRSTGEPGRSRFWRESILTVEIEKLIVYGLILSTIYIWISTFTSWVPRDLESVLRSAFYGAGILCTFISSQRWGRGTMSTTEKTVLLCALIPQLIFMCVGLLLIGALCLIGIALLGYLSGGKRIPWLAIGVVFAIFAVLHNGKADMRTKYWEQENPRPTVTQLPAYFSEWVEFGLQPVPAGGKNVSRKLLERTSLMHILCLVINYTPDRQDYLYGKTYTYVLPQLIPRLFWPDKPRSHIATYELSIYYGLQTEEGTEKTTIAFGLLTEAYANFGIYGAVLLGGFWGFWLKKLQIWSAFSPMFSLAGLLMILMTAWSFNSELTMAVWVSSFFQAIIVVLGTPLLLRSLFGL